MEAPRVDGLALQVHAGLSHCHHQTHNFPIECPCPPLARDMLGVTDSRKAAPGTIRADLGVDMMVNVAHASDSAESAEKEVNRFFRKEELYVY